MKLKTIWAGMLLAGLMVGCGGTSTSENNTQSESSAQIDLPDGKTLIFFDNNTSAQYLYDTDSETYANMNIETENYDMTGKNGKLIVWNHHTAAGVDPKIVMLRDDFSINEGNVTHNDLHYLGHFHEDNNEKFFAAHSADEFDPDQNASEKKLGALDALSAHLYEQEEIRMEIEEALPSSEMLCNFFVFTHDHDHEEADTNETEEEAVPHIVLTTSGKVYVFKEGETGLEEAQVSFSLNGVTECQESESSIIQNGDHGVLIFSAQTQKLYLVDNHGMDFHEHSSWDISRFLPDGFTPTDLAGIGEEEEHDHEHEE
jgi:hypothetical protein